MTLHQQLATIFGLTALVGQHIVFRRSIQRIKTKHLLKIPDGMDEQELKHIYLADVVCKSGKFKEVFQLLIHAPDNSTARTACQLFAAYNSDLMYAGCQITNVLNTDDDGLGGSAWESFLHILYENNEAVNDLYDGIRLVLVLDEAESLVL